MREKKLNKEPFEHKKNGNSEKEERRVGYAELCPKKWCLSIVYKLELCYCGAHGDTKFLPLMNNTKSKA